MENKIAFMVPVCLASCLILGCGGSKGNLTVFPPDAIVESRNYGEWSAEWQKWQFARTQLDNPILDSTGELAHVGQSGPVFFLCGAYTNELVIRRTTVPAGKILFFPIVSAECSNVEPPPFFGGNEQELRVCAKELIDGVSVGSLVATIDGVAVTNLNDFRVQSPLFAFTLPANNILGLPEGTSGISVSDGYWLMVKLPPGNHEIHFEAVIASGPGQGFAQQVTYDLIQD